MDKNPVTVETLDNFSNLDKDASKSPRRDMDPVQYAEYLEGKINMVDQQSRNSQDSNNKTLRNQSPYDSPDKSLSPDVHDRGGSPYNFKQNGKYVTSYRGEASLQQKDPTNVMSQLGSLPSPLKYEDLRPIMVDVNDLQDYQKGIKNRNKAASMRRSNEDRSGAKTA